MRPPADQGRFGGIVARIIVLRHADGLAGLAVEHPVIVLAGQNLVAVDFLDDAPWRDARLLHVKRATLDDLLDTQAVALIGVVQEEAQGSRLERGSLRIVAGARVVGRRLQGDDGPLLRHGHCRGSRSCY